jgi:DNA-damage-inducible protein J
MNTYVRAKIDHNTKDVAIKTLKEMGISISDYIRMAIIQMVNKKTIPFDIEVPNKLTIKTIENSEKGKDIYEAKNTEDLFKKLGI